VTQENGPFSEAIRESELQRAIGAVVSRLDPPTASGSLGVALEYFAATKDVVDHVMAFDERAAAYALRKTELFADAPLVVPFSRAAATRLWETVSTCIDEIEFCLRAGEAPDDIGIMLAKAETIHECSHWIDTVYREKEAEYLLAWEETRRRSQPTQKIPKRRRRAAKAANRTDSEAKLIACLAEHHAYKTANVKCDPIKGSVMANKMGVSEATVSRFMKRYLDGYDGYRRLCAEGPTALAKKLQALNEGYFRGRGLLGDVPD
jgi:hypothetical protein